MSFWFCSDISFHWNEHSVSLLFQSLSNRYHYNSIHIFSFQSTHSLIFTGEHTYCILWWFNLYLKVQKPNFRCLLMGDSCVLAVWNFMLSRSRDRRIFRKCWKVLSKLVFLWGKWSLCFYHQYQHRFTRPHPNKLAFKKRCEYISYGFIFSCIAII